MAWRAQTSFASFILTLSISIWIFFLDGLHGHALCSSFKSLLVWFSLRKMRRSSALIQPILTPKSQLLYNYLPRLLPKVEVCRGRYATYLTNHRPHLSTSAQTRSWIQKREQTRRESTQNHAVSQHKDKQAKAPWHREGSDMPPVARQRSAGAMTKGR